VGLSRPRVTEYLALLERLIARDGRQLIVRPKFPWSQKIVVPLLRELSRAGFLLTT